MKKNMVKWDIFPQCDFFQGGQLTDFVWYSGIAMKQRSIPRLFQAPDAADDADACNPESEASWRFFKRTTFNSRLVH